MTDLLSLYDVLGLPSGAQLVSDRGEVTLLTIAHDGPNKLTLERVPLGAAVSVHQLWQELEQRGLLRGELTSAAPLEGGVGATPLAFVEQDAGRAATRGIDPSEDTPRAAVEGAAAAQQNPSQKKQPGPAKGFKHERVTCQHCGAAFARNNLINHTKACPQRPTEAQAAPDPEPDPAPAIQPVDLPPEVIQVGRTAITMPAIRIISPAGTPTTNRCELCFEPAATLEHVNGRDLCPRCAARRPAPKYEGAAA